MTRRIVGNAANFSVVVQFDGTTANIPAFNEEMIELFSKERRPAAKTSVRPLSKFRIPRPAGGAAIYRHFHARCALNSQPLVSYSPGTKVTF
jgi:hypothetical protein